MKTIKAVLFSIAALTFSLVLSENDFATQPPTSSKPSLTKNSLLQQDTSASTNLILNGNFSSGTMIKVEPCNQYRLTYSLVNQFNNDFAIVESRVTSGSNILGQRSISLLYPAWSTYTVTFTTVSSYLIIVYSRFSPSFI